MYKLGKQDLSPKAQYMGKYVIWDKDGFVVLLTDKLLFEGAGWSRKWTAAFDATEFGKTFLALSHEAMREIWKGYVAQIDELVERSRSLPQNQDYWEEHIFPTMSDKLKMLEYTFRTTLYTWALKERERKRLNGPGDVGGGKCNNL